MRKNSVFMMLIWSLALFVACSSANGPESVAKKAVAAIQKGDYATYAATFDLSPSEQKMLAGMAEDKIDEEVSDRGGIKSYKITDSEVTGNSATVTVHVVYKDSSEDDQIMDFVKVNGKWKQEMNK